MVDLNGALGLALPQSVVNGHAAAQSGSAATKANAANAGSNITGADFLTLLVSELKNQDPTQPTDPQAYVQQLVGVNSLEQLIQINKDLVGSGSSSTSPIGSSGTSASHG